MKALKKRPIQIYIEPEQQTLLETLATRKGVSKASIIREGLEMLFRQLPVEEDPAMGLVGLGSSGKRDLAEMHDQYLVEYTQASEK